MCIIIIVMVVVKSSSYTNTQNQTASHLYIKYNRASLRDKLFIKVKTKTTKSSQGEKGEKEEKEEKETNYDILDIDEKTKSKDEEKPKLSLDVTKVINTLSVHLEKTQITERKEKMIDKKKGNIIYNTKDGRILQAFHSCEQGKIIWDDNVYDNLKTWLAVANIVAPSRWYD